MRLSVVGAVVILGLLLLMGSMATAATVVYQIAASADDAIAKSGTYYSNLAYTYWPNVAGSTEYRGFMRWAVNIPKTAGYNTIIDSAYLSNAGYSGSSTPQTLRVYLLDYDSCPAFTSNPHSWSVTGTYADATAATTGWLTWFNSTADIKTVVQAFVDRAGYASGNYLGLRGEGVSGGTAIRAASYDQGASYGAKLTVTYHQELINQPPVADAGDDDEAEDSDDDGYAAVTLDGTGSTDDGTIASYVWSEGATQLATGATAGVNLSLGTHEITLTVTDDGNSTDTDTVTITVTEAERVRTYVIATSRDDTATESAANGYLYTAMYWPYNSTARTTFLRWQVYIPKGATITQAYVNVRSTGSIGAAQQSVLRMQAVDAARCPEFLTNPFAWTLDSTYVDTTYPTTWTAGQWYASADISAVIQDYIDREDYAPGKVIGLRGCWVSGTYRQIYGWDYGDHTSGPELEIHYTGGDHTLELWMADPETRLGQKVYCQIYERSATDTLRVKLDGNVVATVAAPLEAEEIVTVNYRNLAAGSHTLLVDMVGADNTVQTSESRTWTKLHDGIAAVALNEHNALCRDGVPFFPVKPFGAEVDDWNGEVNAMFGLPFSVGSTLGDWLNFLDDGLEAGLPVAGPNRGNYWPGGYFSNIVEIPEGSSNWVYLTEYDYDRMAEYIEASKDCPSLLMYSWHDEPDMAGASEYIPATEVRTATDTCHANDTGHPHYVNLIGYSFTGNGYPNYNTDRIQSYCFLYSERKTVSMGANEPFAKKTLVADIMGFDYYPYERDLMTGYSTWIGITDLALALDRAREWNYNLIPVMTWIETCDIGECTGDQETPLPPTPTELNHLVWMSIIHGVKGIGWFHYFNPTPDENKAIMRKAVQWTEVLGQAILSAPEDVTWTVSEQELSSERVDILTRQYENRLYVFAAHMEGDGSGETVRFNVTGLPANAVIGVVGESRTITASAGYFDDTFSPLAVHIYTYPAMTNMIPVAKAGVDQYVTDSDVSGAETVTLTGVKSFDADGTLSSYVWKEGTTQIATGSTASVSLSTGTHTITLTITDSSSATASDTVAITVNPPPVADAGEDQEEEDADNDGHVTIALDGSASSDALGEIVSYVWSKDGYQIATGETAQVTLLPGTHTITLTVTDDDGATDTDTMTAEIINENVVNVQYQIAASADDTWCASGAGDNMYTSTAYYFPYTTTDRRVFLRWPLAIPDGSTILYADVQVKSTGSKGDSNATVVSMQLVDSDTCAAFSTNPFSRSVTATYVNWTLPGAWTAATWYTSGDVSPLVQEFIDRAGYASGNYLGLRCMNSSGLWKQAYQWDYDTHTSGAVLRVTYLPPQ